MHAPLPQSRPRLAWLVAASGLSLATALAAHAEVDPGPARALYLTGHYPEARKAYAALAAQQPVAAAIGVARCQAAVGDPDGARRTLHTALARDPGAAAARSALAALEFDRGEYPAAQ